MLHASPDSGKFLLAQPLIDALNPMGLSGSWPSAEQATIGLRALYSLPKSAMVPSFRPGYQTRAERISLDVPADDQNVLVILDRKAFEAGLVPMALSRSVVMGVIRLSVRRRHPAKPLTHPAVFGWTQHQVPMIGHQPVGVEYEA